MAGLFKGMTGQQALQTGSDFLKMGIGTALEKQRREEEKKRLKFEQMIKKQALQLERKRLDLLQSELDMKNTMQEAKLEETVKYRHGIEDIQRPPGRRPIGPGGLPFSPEQRQQQKAFQLAVHGMKYDKSVPAAIGQMAKGVTPQISVSGDRIIKKDPVTGTVTTEELPKTEREKEKERKEQEEIKRKAREKEEKEIYDDLVADWNENAKQERKKGRDPGIIPIAQLMNQAKAIVRAKEEKGYAPVQGVAGPELGMFEGGLRSLNPFQNGWLGWWGKQLGIGPNYKLGGRPGITGTQTKPAQSIDPEEEAYISLYSGIISPEQARKEYRAMKKLNK